MRGIELAADEGAVDQRRKMHSTVSGSNLSKFRKDSSAFGFNGGCHRHIGHLAAFLLQ